MYQLLNSINNTAKKLLKNELNIGMFDPENTKVITGNQIILKEYSSCIKIHQPFRIKIVLSIDSRLVKSIYKKNFNQDIVQIDENILLENMTNEILNNIIGNSTDVLYSLGQPITFTIPFFIKDLQDIGKILRAAGWKVNFDTADGNFFIYYLHDFNGN